MKESGEVLYESGHVVNVTVVTLGDEVDGDHAAAATTVTVGDCADFDADCWVLIDGNLYQVESVDDDANTITLASGLLADVDDGEVVELWDPLYLQVSSYKSIDVRVFSEDSNEDVIEAVLADHLVSKLEEGLRGVRGESVLLEMDGDEWRVVDVLGFGDPAASSLGGARFKIDNFTATTDGDQTLALSFTPATDSLHVYHNGLELEGSFVLVGSTVLITATDDEVRVGDKFAAKYAYRGPAVGVPVTPENPGETYLVEVIPSTTDLAGTIAPPAGSWPATVTLGSNWNGTLIQNDQAIVDLETGDTSLPDDPTGINVFLLADVVMGGNVDSITVRVINTVTSALILSGSITAGGSISLQLAGDVTQLLALLNAGDAVEMLMFPLHTTAVDGTDEVSITNPRLSITEEDL